MPVGQEGRRHHVRHRGPSIPTTGTAQIMDNLTPRLVPLVSGLVLGPSYGGSIAVFGGRYAGSDEAVDALPAHGIGAHEAGEGERGFDDTPGGPGAVEQRTGDRGDGGPDAHGIGADAEEVADARGLLDPPEEQLEGPVPLVEVGDVPGRGLEVVGEDRNNLPVSVRTRTSRTGLENGFLRLQAWRCGSRPMRSERMLSPSSGRVRSVLAVNGVLDLKRVTMRQPAASRAAHRAWS